MTPLYRYAIGLVLISIGGESLAQGCSNAIPITQYGSFSGNTCSGTNELTRLANGSTFVGPEVIYAARPTSPYSEAFNLHADPSSNLSVFVCRNPCKAYSTCVDIADVDSTGVAWGKNLPPADYVVVVSSAVGTCGAYTLDATGPIND